MGAGRGRCRGGVGGWGGGGGGCSPVLTSTKRVYGILTNSCSVDRSTGGGGGGAGGVVGLVVSVEWTADVRGTPGGAGSGWLRRRAIGLRLLPGVPPSVSVCSLRRRSRPPPAPGLRRAPWSIGWASDKHGRPSPVRSFARSVPAAGEQKWGFYSARPSRVLSPAGRTWPSACAPNSPHAPRRATVDLAPRLGSKLPEKEPGPRGAIPSCIDSPPPLRVRPSLAPPHHPERRAGH